MWEFIRSRTFVMHLVMALAFVFLLMAGTYYWLGAYTNHGESIVVPDIKGRLLKNIDEELAKHKLRIMVADSSVYLMDRPGGLIIDQDPSAGSSVKENRTIYVTVSRIVPPQVKMPNVIDVSDRQAEAILLSYGLKTGNKTYKPDLAKDAVLEMTWKGKLLKPGDDVPKGSVIDLVLGDGYGNTEVSVPVLTGLTFDEAIFALKASSLAVGAVVYSSEVRDTLSAIVYRQMPEPGDSVLLRQGESVDLYLRNP